MRARRAHGRTHVFNSLARERGGDVGLQCTLAAHRCALLLERLRQAHVRTTLQLVNALPLRGLRGKGGREEALASEADLARTRTRRRTFSAAWPSNDVSDARSASAICIATSRELPVAVSVCVTRTPTSAFSALASIELKETAAKKFSALNGAPQIEPAAVRPGGAPLRRRARNSAPLSNVKIEDCTLLAFFLRVDAGVCHRPRGGGGGGQLGRGRSQAEERAYCSPASPASCSTAVLPVAPTSQRLPSMFRVSQNSVARIAHRAEAAPASGSSRGGKVP